MRGMLASGALAFVVIEGLVIAAYIAYVETRAARRRGS